MLLVDTRTAFLYLNLIGRADKIFNTSLQVTTSPTTAWRPTRRQSHRPFLTMFMRTDGDIMLTMQDNTCTPFL
jgi:hypothetical protein